jgi:hypothetical protein
VLAALQPNEDQVQSDNERGLVGIVERIVVTRDYLLLTLTDSDETSDPDGIFEQLKIVWSTKARDSAAVVESCDVLEGVVYTGLILSVARAHAWMRCRGNQSASKGRAPSTSARISTRASTTFLP